MRLFSTARRRRVFGEASAFCPAALFYRGNSGKLTLKVKDQPEYQLIECLKAIGITTAGEIRRLKSRRNPHDGQTQWEL